MFYCLDDSSVVFFCSRLRKITFLYFGQSIKQEYKIVSHMYTGIFLYIAFIPKDTFINKRYPYFCILAILALSSITYCTTSFSSIISYVSHAIRMLINSYHSTIPASATTCGI